MKVRYRGIINPSGSSRVSGCQSCGGRRLKSAKLDFLPSYTMLFEGREYTFYIGREYDVSDELAEVLLKKFSYRSGIKFMAFEEVIND